jgi:PAS domain S-box-containing protein
MTTLAVPRILPNAMDARTLHPAADKHPTARSEDRLRLLIDTGLLLSSERSLDVIVQSALDAGLALCGAMYGAFLYNNLGSDGEPYQLFKVRGINPSVFAGYLMPQPAAGLGSTFYGESVVRSEDIRADPRFDRSMSVQALPAGALEVRSYLSVPVRSRGGEVFGTLLYGHPEPAVFATESESLVATVASQAAVAMENARLTEILQREIALADAARAEQRSAERRLRLALDAAQLGTWSWRATTGLVDFDQRGAELFGVAAHVPISRDYLRDHIVLREDVDLTAQDLRTVLAAGGQYRAEYRIRLPDETERWIAANGTAALDEAGQIKGMTGTVQDITLRKNQENSLRQSEKLAATGRLAATIAHEINNPLEAVTNLIYLAKTDPSTPGPVQRMLDTADNELARVSQIAQQTLGFYRDTTRPVTINVNEMLQAVVDLFGRKIAGKRIQITLDLDPDLSIVGLQGEIRQVVSNLLVNAIDASPSDGGSIRIRGRHRHRNGTRGVSVMISDRGSGIPRHVQGRLFTPFVTTKQSRGTGLGLWVTRGMVEKHGGTVRFRSRTDEPAGTVFRVYLPQTAASQLFDTQSSAILQ